VVILLPLSNKGKLDLLNSFKRAALTVFALTISILSYAQTGKISGTVTDKKTGETLIGVTVKIKGTTKGTSTGADGKYTIAALQDGKFIIEASYVGYATKEVPAVEVNGGGTTTLNLALEESNSQKLADVQVKGVAGKESETALLSLQKNAIEIKQGIGIQELSRKGVSDVEEGLTKITGITKVDGRGLFVRGLEDRYNNLLINGLAVPSNNPFKKIIPLDLFPTDIVSVLETYKTFNSGLYGDFAGGTFNIVTAKGEKAVTKINIGTSFLSNSSFKKFLRPEGETSVGDYFGFPNNGRDLPKVFGKKPSSYTMTANEANTQFGSGFDVEEGNAPLNTNISILHTQKIRFENNRYFQYLVSINTDNNFQIREGVDRFFNTAQGNYDNNLYTTKYRFSTNSSLLGAINYGSNRLNLNLNAFYLKGTETMIQDQLGYTNSQATVTNSFIRLNQLQKTDFFTGQLFANYKITEDEAHGIRAGVSYSKTRYQLPDRKFFIGAKLDENRTAVSYGGNSIVRQYMDFNGDFFASGLLEYNWKFGNEDLSKAHKLSLGYNGSFNKIESDFRFLISQNLSSNGITFNTNQPDATFSSELSNGNFTYKDGSNSTYKARMQEGVNAGYADLALVLNDKLNLNVGTRFEQSQRITRYRNSGSFDDPFVKITKDNFDILPSINLKYSATEKANFRLSVSKTLTKPVIMEAYPLEFVNPDATIENGNPNVVNSKNYNLDIKYELFPTNKEMLAVTGFAKFLDNPIERLFVQSAGSGGLQITYNNSEKAILYGAELEFLLQLSRLTESLKDFSVGFNTSLMVTKVTIDKLNNSAETAAQKGGKRNLQGASPWLINADIKYEADLSKKWKSTMTLAYNVYGERIYAVGTNGLDHYYEKPFGKLDFIWNNKISNNWEVKFGVENILNPTYRIDLGNESIIPLYENDLTVKDYKRGVGVSLGLGYTF